MAASVVGLFGLAAVMASGTFLMSVDVEVLEEPRIGLFPMGSGLEVEKLNGEKTPKCQVGAKSETTGSSTSPAIQLVQMRLRFDAEEPANFMAWVRPKAIASKGIALNPIETVGCSSRSVMRIGCGSK